MLNFHEQGTAIAINNKTARVLYVSDDILSDKNFYEMDEEGSFEILPSTDKNKREVLYIAGPSGVGKSTICKEYIKKYQKLHPKHDVYIFSKLKEDETFKDLKKIFKIPINKQLVEDPIDTLTDMENSLVIFDDIDTVTDKSQALALTHIINEILELGRHKNISVCITSHLINPQDKKRGRTILNEAHRVVIFPRSTTHHNVKYFLQEYIGVRDKDVLVKIMETKSRWICIHKVFPMYILSQKSAVMI